MLLAMNLFWGAAALELLLWLIPPLAWRRIIGGFLLLPLAATTLYLFWVHPSLPTAVLVAASIYRVVNLIRLIKARMNEKYLRRSTLHTSMWLIGLQAVIVILWQASQYFQISTGRLWLVLVCTDLGLSVVLFVSTARNLWTTRPPKMDGGLPDSGLPSLTVAIPARNETDDLEACLTSLVSSNYPKLEILVLDDCSQDKRTPEIIRSYAHDGVRFLQGRVPEDNWLAKNQAYQQLYEESNGELILFCGVDTRFTADSLRSLVSAMIQKHKTMISVIPKNAVPAAFTLRSSTLLQPMRYAWELALPRRAFHRPPVLSTCWIVKRDLITTAGGFAAVSRSIVPESYFARVSAVHDGYSFMQGSDRIGIVSNKSVADQQDTAVRTRYPQVHRRIEMVLLLTIIELVGIIMPYVLSILAAFGLLSSALSIMSIITVSLLTLMYISIVALTYRAWLVRAILLLPFATILDVMVLNYSMVRYEFFSVSWKGRNVCIPVMRVVDHLPEL